MLKLSENQLSDRGNYERSCIVSEEKRFQCDGFGVSHLLARQPHATSRLITGKAAPSVRWVPNDRYQRSRRTERPGDARPGPARSCRGLTANRIANKFRAQAGRDHVISAVCRNCFVVGVVFRSRRRREHVAGNIHRIVARRGGVASVAQTVTRWEPSIASK